VSAPGAAPTPPPGRQSARGPDFAGPVVYIAMQQNDDTGSPVTWGEHVTDQQYNSAATVAERRG